MLFIRGSVLGVLIACTATSSQTDYSSRLGVRQGAELSYAPQGPGVMINAIDPAVRRWYVPQELFEEHRWRQWEYTNYAKDTYQRYVSNVLEGDYFYDLYGGFVTRGWLIYNNAQTSPQQFGNALVKSQRFQDWFSGLLVASDQKGQYRYSMSISNRLRTTLTPMTFSKPMFDGIQFDLATDRYEATLLYSRISDPGGSTTGNSEKRITNLTSLVGGRFTAQMGSFVKVGAHVINSHQGNTLSDKVDWTPFAGALTVDQNQTIGLIQIVLRDDSPEDGEGGAAFFPEGSDIIITYEDGRVLRGKDFQLEPVIDGGFVRQGFLAADGAEEIRLLYDFDGVDYLQNIARYRADNGLEDDSLLKDDIVGVDFELQIGNDYQVWMTSDRQTDINLRPALLLVTQAEGNVKDITNLRTLHFSYGLPTATHIAGATLEVRELLGFDLYAEYDLSWSYRKYPKLGKDTHGATSGIDGDERAPAWMVNVAHQADPFFLFSEFYSMDPRYNTRTFVTAPDGRIDYTSERNNVIEMVEDNDDQDIRPDTVRRDWRSGDGQVFPGWDQNNDFIPDFNQNDSITRSNAEPDYDEPFLRFFVDRPEFLFGVDLNHNFWIDQYENDEEPDYPYRKDHEGYNVYVGADITPEIKLSVGTLREQLISSNKRNHSTYAVLTLDVDTPRFGRLRLFDMTQKVEDNIPNPLLQWAPDNTLRGGEMVRVEDPLLGQDTWVNQFFGGHTMQTGPWFVMSKVSYIHYRQLNRQRREQLGLDSSEFFFGVINKASYRWRLGSFTVEPRWKSEFIKQSRGLLKPATGGAERTALTELFSGLVETSILRATLLQTGIEYALVNDLDDDALDFDSLSWALQFANQSDYLGYNLKTLVGTVMERRDFKGQRARTTNRFFITVFAGLE